MSKHTIKFKQLVKAESYLQINLVKGFRYIDTSGELLNLYVDEKNIPDHSIGLQGMIVKQPTKDISKIKISSDVIWAKFEKIDSLDFISTKFLEEAKKICKILNVNKISRIGWRNFFAYELIGKDPQQTISPLINIDKFSIEEIRGKYKFGENFESTIFIKPVVKNDETKTKGIGIDIDNFSGKVKTLEDLESIMSSIKKSFKEELFEEFINKIIHV